LLLDRKKIRKWAKWVALGLAIVFVLSFLFMGVGYGGAGFNVSAIFSGGCTETTVATVSDTKLAAYLATLDTDPDNLDALQGAASSYLAQNDYTSAALYLERVIEVDPTKKDVYLSLAQIYLRDDVNNYQAAAAVLNKATAVDPDNPDVFLALGIAQRALGNTAAAVMAWQKYLQLDPEGDSADAVRQELEEMTAESTTTTAAATSTTGASGTSSATSTTVSATTTTTE
jgi:tetratricopeptide (TPR) repeat protein